MDFFAIYCPETCGVYLVPIEDLPVKVSGALRVAAARNGQKHGIRSAAQYRIG